VDRGGRSSNRRVVRGRGSSEKKREGRLVVRDPRDTGTGKKDQSRSIPLLEFEKGCESLQTRFKRGAKTSTPMYGGGAEDSYWRARCNRLVLGHF